MQLGFDRLIEAMDKLAPDLDQTIIAQTGKGTYRAFNFDQYPSIDPARFEDLIKDARLIVSHAGIGTVLTAARFAKPIVLFPRRAKLSEHRNDHQIATCRQLEGRAGIFTAFEVADLKVAISKGLETDGLSLQDRPVGQSLKAAITEFIDNGHL